jgi:hypothetical protein
MPFLTILKPIVGLNLDHFACMREVELSENNDKDHRNNTYTDDKRCENPNQDVAVAPVRCRQLPIISFSERRAEPYRIDLIE